MKNLLSYFLIICTLSSCQTQLQNGQYFEKIGDYKINYSIKGKGSDVMLVGHPASGKIGYELTLKPLEEKFKMIYYEPRGTGKSETPKSIDEYNQDDLVQEIENLRKKLNIDKIWLFGHSDQSAIAMIYALKFPNHTKGLILTGTSYVGTQEETFQRRRMSEHQRIKESEWFANVVKDWDYMIENKTDTNEKGKDISDAPLKWWCYDEASSQKVIPIVREISKQGRRKPINDEYYIETKEERQKYLSYQNDFNKIQCSVLIVNGKHDTNNPPKYAEDLHKVLSNSTLILIDKAGHFPWIEKKKSFFGQLDDWLSPDSALEKK